MSNLYKELQKEKEELESAIKQADAFLQEAPEGQLKIAEKGNRHQYYLWRKEEKEKYPNGRYIKNCEKELVGMLAQKSYYQKVLNVAKYRLKKLEKCFEDYEEDELTKIYEQLKPSRKKLVQPIRLPDDMFIKQWENVTYKKRVFAPGDQEIYTEKGERVLSKSEKILADKFYLMKIPYRYEYPLELSGMGIVHPDFMLLNKRTRKEYYWEHLGMMDDQEYCVNAIRRIEIYEKNNILPGKQLILTYETKSCPLNIKVVERLIEAYFC
ncbi:MAG: hypothetical protein LUD14_00670 [Clostridiales bacterium]|nr:hypothetical protein [Clostridiales bacterium]